MRPRLLALLALALVLPACSGQDAQQAQDLLAEASAAQQHVRSSTLTARLWTEADGQRLEVDLAGGGYASGPRKGDFFLRGAVTGVPGAGSFTVVRQGGTEWADLDGRRQTLPVPTTQPPSPISSLDLARYVKSVSVGDTTLDGVPMKRIGGTLDTAAFGRDLLAGAGGVGSALPLGRLGDALGDTHAVLYVDEASHLVTRALIDIPLRAQGKTLVLHLTFAVTGVNRPVRFPS